jgi:hypothetical protein
VNRQFVCDGTHANLAVAQNKNEWAALLRQLYGPGVNESDTVDLSRTPHKGKNESEKKEGDQWNSI